MTGHPYILFVFWRNFFACIYWDSLHGQQCVKCYLIKIHKEI